MKERLIICVGKYPEAGKVKTRLGEKIGMQKASDVQKKFFDELISNNYNQEASFDMKFCLLPFEKASDFSQTFGVKIQDIFPSSSSELGSMMGGAIEHGLNLGYKEVLLIGSDVPTQKPADFLVGFHMLGNSDVVLGGSPDGGYYIVGMKKAHHEIFQDIVYSTETVLEETTQKCREYNLSYSLIKLRMDIDDYDDLVSEVENDDSGFYKSILNFINEK